MPGDRLVLMARSADPFGQLVELLCLALAERPVARDDLGALGLLDFSSSREPATWQVARSARVPPAGAAHRSRTRPKAHEPLAGPGRWLHCVDATLVPVARAPEVCHEV